MGAVALGCAALLLCAQQGAVAQSAATPTPITDYAAEAREFEKLVNQWYAYPERLPEGQYRLTDHLRDEATKASDRRSLLRFAERAILLLADHHAILGSSFADSWAIVPSYSDMWVERRDRRYVITAVRPGSPAAAAGITAGGLLLAVDHNPTGVAVASFWSDLGATGGEERDPFAARVLAAGRRDRERRLTVRLPGKRASEFVLANLYGRSADATLLSVTEADGELRIAFNNSLGDSATIEAFDVAMLRARPGQHVTLDLRNTPGGGNTTVARAIMGWFVQRPTPYQRHALPSEQRNTGIAREWLELVLPREGKFHAGPVKVSVGRWTGSMGEGMALGFREIGACVVGEPMAGLLGAIGDFEIGATGLKVKLPFERLMSVAGIPREQFSPAVACR